jgi:hypothetical protein
MNRPADQKSKKDLYAFHGEPEGSVKGIREDKFLSHDDQPGGIHKGVVVRVSVADTDSPKRNGDYYRHSVTIPWPAANG